MSLVLLPMLCCYSGSHHNSIYNIGDIKAIYGVC